MKPIEKIVIDANALLSIVIGGKAARRIVSHPNVPELYVTLQAYAKMEEYIPVLTKRKRMNEELLWSIWRGQAIPRHSKLSIYPQTGLLHADSDSIGYIGYAMAWWMRHGH